MQNEQQEGGYDYDPHDWEMQAWDDYEVDEEREWERVGWLEDLLVPLDNIISSD